MAFDSKKFLTRTGSAAVFVVVLLGCIFWNYYSFSALFFVVSLWGLHEFYKLMKLNGYAPQQWVGYLIAVCCYTLLFLVKLNYVRASEDRLIDHQPFFTDLLIICSRIIPLLVLMLIFMYPIFELFRKKEKPFENIALTLFGVFYVVIPFLLLNQIATSYLPALSDEAPAYPFYKPQLVFALFLLIWSNDTFAYLCGSFIGKHKMIERISPGKTWEGTIGGALLTVGVSCFFHRFFGMLLLPDWIIIAVIVTVFGTLGDLVESMLKRSVGVKDSGKIMPGHGGILDRFDSLILVAPFVFLYLLFK